MAITQFSFDLDNAYLYWPNRETVAFTSNRTASDAGGDVLTTQLQAKRFELDFRELAVGGGTYAAEDIIWLIPATLLPAGIEPKMSDTIRDAANNTWDVLNVSYEALESAYACISRDAVIVHNLRDVVTLWAPTNAQDTSAARVPTFAQSGSDINARIQLVSETFREERGKRLNVKTYEIFVATELTLTHEYQIRDASSNVYQIIDYTNRARLGELSMIRAERFGD